MHCETGAGKLQMEQPAATYLVKFPRLANVSFTVPQCEWHKISFAAKIIVL